MKIYLLSDLHVEFFRNFHLPNIDGIDVVVLAGDLKPGSGTLDVAVAFQQHCQAPVILVAGNHEFYGYNHKQQLSALRCEAAKLPDIHFLENESVIIGGARFLGCTLWSNFALFGDDHVARAKATAQQCIADFDVIRCGNRKFTPDDAAAEFALSYAWLNDELAKPFWWSLIFYRIRQAFIRITVPMVII